MMNTMNNMDSTSRLPRIVTALFAPACEKTAAHFLTDRAITAVAEHVKTDHSVNQTAFIVGYMDGFTSALAIVRNELLGISKQDDGEYELKSDELKVLLAEAIRREQEEATQ